MEKISHGWAGPEIDARIAAHVRAWEKARSIGLPLQLEQQPFVTISREFGCEALPLAQRLVELLNERFHPSVPWVAYERELLERVAHEMHLRQEIVESIDELRRDEMTELIDSILNRKVDEALVLRKMAEVVRSLAMHGHVVLVGRGGYLITQNLKNGLHVRLVAPRQWRIRRVANLRNVPYSEAEQIVEKRHSQRAHFLRTFFLQNPDEPFHFSLVIDNSQFTLTQIAEIVVGAVATRFGERLQSAFDSGRSTRAVG